MTKPKKRGPTVPMSPGRAASTSCRTTSSGGVCVNDALTHLLVSSLPFGGVGESGYGSYHGRWGIETFSHHKAVYRRPSWHRDLPLLNPPYGRFKKRAARRMF